MIGSSLVLGMTFGALGGGRLMAIGRRRAAIISCVLGIMGTGITILPLNYERILLGRLLFGVSVGLLSAIAPKMLEETIPNYLFDKLGAIFTTTQGIGVLIAVFSAEILPDDEDTNGLTETELWRVMYGYIPIFLYSF